MISGLLNIVLSFHLITKALCTPTLISNAISEIDVETPKSLFFNDTDEIELHTTQDMSHLLEKHKNFLKNYMETKDNLRAPVNAANQRVQSESFRHANGGNSKDDLQFQMISVSRRDVNRVKSLLQDKYQDADFEALNFMHELDQNAQSVLLYYTSRNRDEDH